MNDMAHQTVEAIPAEEVQTNPEAQEAQVDAADITLPDMTYDELEALKEAAIAKQREQRNKERAVDINTIKTLILKHGLKWGDIKPTKTVNKVAPKYRHPETGATWTGRGKPPLWIRDVENRDEFLIA